MPACTCVFFFLGTLFFSIRIPSLSLHYNKLINVKDNIHHEKLYRKDHKYDLLIPIEYNSKHRVLGKGSCIFLHLTKNYHATAGCIAVQKKDFLILLKLINKKTKITIS